jgi:hypothetical protein
MHNDPLRLFMFTDTFFLTQMDIAADKATPSLACVYMFNMEGLNWLPLCLVSSNPMEGFAVCS